MSEKRTSIWEAHADQHFCVEEWTESQECNGENTVLALTVLREVEKSVPTNLAVHVRWSSKAQVCVPGHSNQGSQTMR